MTIYEPKPVDDAAELSNADIQKMAGGYPHTPDDVRELDASAPTTRKEALKAPEPKKRFWTKGRIIGGVVVGALTAVGGTGAVILANQPAIVEQGDPGEDITDPVTNPDNGEGTPVTNPEVITVESETLPTGLSNEQLADYVVTESLTRWANAGQTQETFDAYITFLSNGEGTIGDFTNREAAKYGIIYGQALFGPDYLSNDNARTVVDALVIRNSTVLGNWLMTFNSGNPDDEKPFNFSTKSESVVIDAEDDTSFTASAVELVENNAASNRIGKDPDYANDGLPKNGDRINVSFVVNTSGPTPVLSSFNFVAS